MSKNLPNSLLFRFIAQSLRAEGERSPDFVGKVFGKIARVADDIANREEIWIEQETKIEIEKRAALGPLKAVIAKNSIPSIIFTREEKQSEESTD